MSQSTQEHKSKEKSKEYQEQGWSTSFPLPEGKKSKPPVGVTGNVSQEQGASTAEQAWSQSGDTANLGLRLPSTVIALDVDHYGDKTGNDTLEALEQELGPLPATWRSTKRGAGNPSGQRFFKVPEGFKWADKAGESIDIVQMTHRYSVVWPSIVDEEQYRWIDPQSNLSSSVPPLAELPELPKEWIDHLKNKELSLKGAPQFDLSTSEALEWLQVSASGYNQPMGPLLASKCNAESPSLQDFASNGHDTLTDLHHWAIKCALEDGAHGLGEALDWINQEFTKAVESRRGVRTLRQEVERSLIGAINLVRGELEAGNLQTFQQRHQGFTGLDLSSLGGAQKATAKRDETKKKFSAHLAINSSDTLAAKLLACVHPDWTAGAIQGGASASGLYDSAKNCVVEEDNISAALANDVKPWIVELLADLDDDAEDKATKLKAVLKYCDTNANGKKAMGQLRSLLYSEGKTTRIDKLDRTAHLVGLKGGKVFDLERFCKIGAEGGLSGEGVIRPALAGDLVTKAFDVSEDDLLALDSSGTTTSNESLLKAMCSTASGKFLEERYRDLRQFLGYSALWGANPYNLLPVLWGKGGNGKNALLNSLVKLGPDYISKVNMSAFMKTAEGSNQELSQVLTSRLGVVDELQGDKFHSIARLKEIVGGSELVTRANYGDMQSSGTLTPLLMTNNAIPMRVGNAERRRFRVIRLEATQKAVAESMPSATEDWRSKPEEKAWLFRWLVEGMRYAFANEEHGALKASDLTMADTEAFFGDADPVRAWVMSAFEFTGNEEDSVTTEKIKMAWNTEDRETGELGAFDPTRSMRQLKSIFTELGAEHKAKIPTGTDGKRVAGYRGVKLRTEVEEVELSRSSPVELDVPSLENRKLVAVA